MKFYFDETGDFAVPSSLDEPAAGIVVGISVPETAEPEVFRRFKLIIDRLPPSALKNGEPKGAQFPESSLEEFCELVRESEEIIVTPVVLDLESLAAACLDVKGLVVVRLLDWAERCKHQTMRSEIQLLAKQFGNLSLPQALRLGTLARCIMHTLHGTIILRARREYWPAWEKICFEIDAVQQRPGSREQQVFQWMLLSWVTAWSVDFPFDLVSELHIPEHPFVKRYDTPSGIDLGAVLQDNVVWQASAKSRGIQMADVAATVVARAIRGLVTPADLNRYGRLLVRTVQSPERAPGIFSFVKLAPDIARRYAGLAEAVGAVRCVYRR